jgi:hypothetical protein
MRAGTCRASSFFAVIPLDGEVLDLDFPGRPRRLKGYSDKGDFVGRDNGSIALCVGTSKV